MVAGAQVLGTAVQFPRPFQARGEVDPNNVLEMLVALL